MQMGLFALFEQYFNDYFLMGKNPVKFVLIHVDVGRPTLTLIFLFSRIFRNV